MSGSAQPVSTQFPTRTECLLFVVFYTFHRIEYTVELTASLMELEDGKCIALMYFTWW